MAGANTQPCANCTDTISPRIVNVGGPVGAIEDGWLHSATGEQRCRDDAGALALTMAAPVVEEAGE